MLRPAANRQFKHMDVGVAVNSGGSSGSTEGAAAAGILSDLGSPNDIRSASTSGSPQNIDTPNSTDVHSNIGSPRSTENLGDSLAVRQANEPPAPTGDEVFEDLQRKLLAVSSHGCLIFHCAVLYTCFVFLSP